MACCNPIIVAEIVSQDSGSIAGNTKRIEKNSGVIVQNNDGNERIAEANAQTGGESKTFTVRASFFSLELFDLH